MSFIIENVFCENNIYLRILQKAARFAVSVSQHIVILNGTLSKRRVVVIKIFMGEAYLGNELLDGGTNYKHRTDN